MNGQDLYFLAFFAIVILVLAAVWAVLRFIFKQKVFLIAARIFLGFVSRIREGIRKFTAKYGSRGDFVDEHESLFSRLALLRGSLRRRKDTEDEEEYPREIPWDRLKNNRERVRFIYRYFLRFCINAGFSFNNKKTPNQLSSDIIAWNPVAGEESTYFTEIYNLARYGPDNRDIDNDIVDTAVGKTKELKTKREQKT
jgi:hypothetical protein